MPDGSESVNPYVEPQLFASGGIALTLSALIDHDEQTVVFISEARDVGAGKLLALWSSAPVDIWDFDRERARAFREFSEELRKATGPFP